MNGTNWTLIQLDWKQIGAFKYQAVAFGRTYQINEHFHGVTLFYGNEASLTKVDEYENQDKAKSAAREHYIEFLKSLG